MDGTQPATALWTELWLSSVALSETCLRRGRTGIADKLGKFEAMTFLSFHRVFVDGRESYGLNVEALHL